MREEFEKYYELPLKVDKYLPCTVYSANNQRAFDFVNQMDNGDIVIEFDVSEERAQDIVDIINGTKEVETPKEKFYYKDSYIYRKEDGKAVLSIRGTGYLRGILLLPKEKANFIQDCFGEYIAAKLNGCSI